MSDASRDVPAEDFARPPVPLGQRVGGRVGQVRPESMRNLLGALVKPGRPVVTLDDLDAVSDEVWRDSGYGGAGK